MSATDDKNEFVSLMLKIKSKAPTTYERLCAEFWNLIGAKDGRSGDEARDEYLRGVAS